MQSIHDSKHQGRPVLVSSPKGIWNCRSLSIHLPPLGERQNSATKDVYSSPPMSASPKHSKSVDPSHYHHSYKQPYTHSPTSQSTSGTQSPILTKSVKSRPPSLKGEQGTASSGAGVDAARNSSQFASDIPALREESVDSSSPPQDSPEAHQLAAGVPGVARRAKAHVPSACVNCKRKHLACETKRPCNRCLSTGKEVCALLKAKNVDWLTETEATCVDVQHKKRGRPRLREEESSREVAFGIDAHAEAYASQTGMIPLTEHGRPRSKSYRELRSQPDNYYSGQRPRTSDAGYGSQYSHGSGGPISPIASYVTDRIPTVLLTPDFRVAQHNYTFADALAAQNSLKGFALLDLVVPSDREKIHRLQSALRAEMLESAHLPPIHGGFDPVTSMPYIEELNIAQATAGFRTRSEYWSFRLPGDRSRGFPISISLARGPGPFVILTLVHGLASSNPMPSPHASSHLSSPTSSHGVHSPTLDQYPMHGHHTNGTSRHYTTQLPATVSQASADRTLLSHSHGLSQYRQTSPPQASTVLPYVHSRTNSGSDMPRSSPTSYPDNARENLRHLQLPPIRTSGSDIEPSTSSEPRRGSAGKGTPVRGSPQSGRKKKRRKVEIGDMLH
ncbi:MAG: hypothetical protein Q9211_007026 [Gyalolechia sp. 1 TL-2023]